MRVRYELIAIDHEGRAVHQEETQTNRFFSVPEMQLLAEVSGLRVREIVPAYRSGPIDSATFHLMLVADNPS
jgi:hypothetical protein